MTPKGNTLINCSIYNNSAASSGSWRGSNSFGYHVKVGFRILEQDREKMASNAKQLLLFVALRYSVG